MKHAGAAALADIETLLAEIRMRPGLVEKKPGIFYRKGQAFLHFHEDPAGMFMDIRAGAEWQRLPLPDAAAWPHAIAFLDAVNRRPVSPLPPWPAATAGC